MSYTKHHVHELSIEQKAALEDLRGAGYTSRIGKRAEAVLLSARGYRSAQSQNAIGCRCRIG